MSRQSCRLKNLASVVRCPCRVDKYVGLMIFCDLCGFWQHGPCFTIIAESYLPAKHCCNNCADPPSKCTDPNICLNNSNLVQATCLYRRTLVLLNTHKGQMIPTKISRLLDVDNSIGYSIIERLLSEKILIFGKSTLSYTVDKKHLLNYAFPKYLNKFPWQVPIHSDAITISSFRKDNSGFNISTVEKPSLPCASENDIENKATIAKNEEVNVDSLSEYLLNSGSETHLNETKVNDLSQEQSVKKLKRLNPRNKKVNFLQELKNEKLPFEKLKHDSKIECSFCNHIFCRKSDLAVHIVEIHSQVYQCSQCEFSIINKNEYSKHVSSHNSNFLQEKEIEKLTNERLKKHLNNKCAICNHKFNKKSNLIAHIKTHSQVYRCSLCDFMAIDKKIYLLHVSLHSRNILQEKDFEKLTPERLKQLSNNECTFCKRKFYRKSNLMVHIEKIHSKVYQCLQCDFSINDKNLYLKHASSHVCLKCSLCDKSFSNKSKLAIHISCVHEKLKQFKCNFCEMIFGTAGNLNVHLRAVHHKLKPFKCALCVLSFKKKDHLKNHIVAVHQREKPLKCPHCDYSAYVKKCISSHIAIKHTKDDKLRPFKCTFCTKTFALKGLLNTHVSAVHIKSKFKCSDCSFVSGYKKNLIHHLNVFHTDGKPHKCSLCQYAFIEENDLKKHVSDIHERMFRCDECGFTTKDSYSLKIHIRRFHLKLKPFQCDECGYRFVEKKYLNKHIRKVHLKKLSCSLCEYTCNGKRDLIVHKKAVHENIDPYQCEDCGYVSNYKWNLVCHMRSAHKK